MAGKSLEERIERLESIDEIQKLMSKYEYFLSAAMFDGILNLFACKVPDISINIGDWGDYRGVEGLKRLFRFMSEMMTQPGIAAETDLSNPVIEVAGDMKTARAVWMGPGFETTRDPRNGNVRAAWCYTRYACDFIKEEGQWKFWRMSNFLTFFADYEKSWAEGGEHYTRRPDFDLPRPDAMAPDGPPAHRHAPYDPNTPTQMLPTFPEPYETWDGNVEWFDPLKK